MDRSFCTRFLAGALFADIHITPIGPTRHLVTVLQVSLNYITLSVPLNGLFARPVTYSFLSSPSFLVPFPQLLSLLTPGCFCLLKFIAPLGAPGSISGKVRPVKASLLA